MKNWLPLVSGPALAMLSTPAASCFIVKFSSLNFDPYMDSPPAPANAHKFQLKSQVISSEYKLAKLVCSQAAGRTQDGGGVKGERLQ